MEITITDIHKRYGDVTALAGPTFTVPSGSTFGVLGTNGAGKTTLFELLIGHNRPDRGRISVGNLAVTEAGHRVRERVGFLPEHVGFPGSLTGREILRTVDRIRGSPGAPGGIDDVLALVGLADAADRAVSGYSNGMTTRLGLAGALLGEPPVLVLDEPTAGLDPRGVETFHRIVQRIGQETDATVVLSSHVMSEIEQLCDHVAILHEGRLCAVDDVDTLCGSVDEDPLVRFWTSQPRNLSRSIEPFGHTDQRDHSVTIEVRRDRVLELLQVVDSDKIDRFEVQEPGLEAVFHAAIEADETARSAEVSA